MERLRISEDGRYFVTGDDRPFSWLADTNWTIPQRLKWDDAEYLMKRRKSQGFTVLQVVALDPERDEEMRNPSGEKALINDNLDTPNEKYFEYLDWIIDKAEEYGLYILLLPVWGQLVVGHDWGGNFYEKTVTEENAYRYGRWIGERYKNKNNIVWCLGGDRQPIHLGVSYKNVWRRMAEGLAKGYLGKDLKYDQKDDAWKDMPVTYHACYEMETGECSTMSYWTEEEAWISFIMLQSGHGLMPKNYEMVAKEYQEHCMPVWDGEPAYEEMPTCWPITPESKFHGTWMVRRRAYWAMMAGAFGHTYGHASVWCCVSEQERNPVSKHTWFESIHSEGSAQMKYLRDFMDSTQIMTYLPCQEILPDLGEDDTLETHLQARAAKDGSTICIYFPGGGSARLNLKSVYRNAPTEVEENGSVYLWWYNPRDGKFYDKLGNETEQASALGMEGYILNVQSPSEGEEQDWVLIVKQKECEAPVKEQTYFEMEENVEVKKVFEW